jgi:hypothetical protein
VTTIRPNILPQTPQARPPEDSARQAAARAFFSAAMGQTEAPRAAVAPTISATTAPQARAAAAQDAPLKIPRPGSLIDIRV